MIRKPLAEIQKADIEELVDNGVAESRTLEYKERLPGNGDAERKEFLADVSALANTLGGDLIYGVVEKRDEQGKPTGIPESADGLDGVQNAEAQIQRLLAMARDGLRPGLHIDPAPPMSGFSKGSVISLRIPQSWAAPHMVTFKGSSRFYGRSGAGKYPMDVDQIREAFALSSAIEDRMRRFRRDRLDLIEAADTPTRVLEAPKIVLHAFPSSAFSRPRYIDGQALLVAARGFQDLHTFGGVGPRFNFDGAAIIRAGPEGVRRYGQLFRDGSFEFVDATCTIPYDGQPRLGLFIEGKLVEIVEKLFEVWRRLEVQPRFFVAVSLLGMTGVSADPRHWHDESLVLERSRYELRERVAEDINSDAGRLLVPVFDTIWQTFGFSGSPHSDDGNWRRP